MHESIWHPQDLHKVAITILIFKGEKTEFEGCNAQTCNLGKYYKQKLVKLWSSYIVSYFLTLRL